MTKESEAGSFAVVLLAAGSSSRLGQAKQLISIDGESLVRRTARMLLSLNPVSLTVVAGCNSPDVEKELLGLEVDVVCNDSWEQGMGGSIACGIRNIAESVEGVLITVCDQWRVNEADLQQLISHWTTDISRVTVASWLEGKARIYGPPALFPRKYIRELKRLEGKRGAKTIIARHRDSVQFASMENAAFDLDTPEDLQQLLNRS